MRRSEAEHHAAHGHQLGQTELQPDAEHKEDDTEFGEVAGLLVIGNEADRVRPDEDADEKIAKQCRQLQNPENHHDHDGCCKQQEHKFQDSEAHGRARR